MFNVAIISLIKCFEYFKLLLFSLSLLCRKSVAYLNQFSSLHTWTKLRHKTEQKHKQPKTTDVPSSASDCKVDRRCAAERTKLLLFPVPQHSQGLRCGPDFFFWDLRVSFFSFFSLSLSLFQVNPKTKTTTQKQQKNKQEVAHIYCNYTHKLYCKQCHLGHRRVIPSKLVYLGDLIK